MNIISIYKKFPDEASCIAYLESIRFKDGKYCLYCGSKRVCDHNLTESKTRNANRLQCQSCHKSFSVTVGTIFHHTHLPLQKWFLAISLILNAKKGISTRQLARDLELPVKTAWSLAMRIRLAMQTEQKELLKGIFEMDETYIRSKKDDDDKYDGMSKRNEKNTSVVAIKQKGGNIKAFATENTTHVTLINLALNVFEKGSEVHTDEYSSYKKFKNYFNHKSVSHEKEYVNADGVHCNGVESFWALLKRGLKGQFHWLSKKHLQAYVTEFEYRYNNRENNEVFGDMLKRLLCI
jgi:transposase-like protein